MATETKYVLVREDDVFIADDTRFLPHQIIYDSMPSYEDVKSYLMIIGEDIVEGTRSLIVNTNSKIIKFKRIYLMKRKWN